MKEQHGVTCIVEPLLQRYPEIEVEVFLKEEWSLARDSVMGKYEGKGSRKKRSEKRLVCHQGSLSSVGLSSMWSFIRGFLLRVVSHRLVFH